MFDQIVLHIWFRIRARHRKGRGIHPPFAYKFITEVIFGNDVPGLRGIEDLRGSLLGNREYLQVSDLGAGSKRIAGEKRSIPHLVKYTAVNRKKGQLLSRIAGYLGFPVFVELGTGTGISSLYLGMACPHSRILTCEGSPEIADLARANIKKMGASNIEVYQDAFLDWLPGILNQITGEVSIFLDGDHKGENLLEYCSMIIESDLSKAVLVLDDIHWSVNMYRAWKKLVKRPDVSLSLELFNTGIIFMGYDIQKSHFIVNF